MKTLRKWLKKISRNERGASMVEYALLVALIAVISILAIQAVGTKVFTAYDTTQSNFPAPGAPTPPTP
jgi:pilus assembly protein Flp/PilA